MIFMSLYSIFNDMFKTVAYMSLILFLGVFLTTNLYGQNANKVVTTNVTTISPVPEQPIQPVVTQPSTYLPVQQVPVVTNQATPQQPSIPSTGNSVVDALMGGLLFLIPTGYALFKQKQNTDQIAVGLNRSTQVQTQTVESMKGTDYTDEDIMRIFVALMDKLDKVGIVKEVINEKMKTTPEDLLLNNRSVRESAGIVLAQIIREHKEYYSNLQSSPDDTCSNQYLRN